MRHADGKGPSSLNKVDPVPQMDRPVPRDEDDEQGDDLKLSEATPIPEDHDSEESS